jgi:hypothetical protein
VNAKYRDVEATMGKEKFAEIIPTSTDISSGNQLVTPELISIVQDDTLCKQLKM